MRYHAEGQRDKRKLKTHIPLVEIKASKRKSTKHDRVLVILSTLIKNFSERVNVDHVKPPIALDKTLKLTDERGRKYDIAFIYEGELFLIEVRRYRKWR